MKELTLIFPSKNKYTVTHSHNSEYLQYLSDIGNTGVYICRFEDIFKDIILNKDCDKWIGNNEMEEYAMQGIAYFNCKELLCEFYELRKERRRKELLKDIENFFEGIITPEDDMIRNINLHKLDWGKFSRNISISEQFFERYIDHVHWDGLLCNTNISEQFYEKHIKDKRWYRFLRNEKVSEQFIEKYFEFIDKNWFFYNYKISDKFINENEGKIDWNILSRNIHIDDEFCKKHIDKVQLGDLAYNKNITEDFFRYYFSVYGKDFWTERLLYHPNISQDFINEFYVPYHGGYNKQVDIIRHLTDLFSQITKEECKIIFEDPAIPLKVIMYNTLPLHILEYCAENFPEKLSWTAISGNPNITEQFCEKYIEYFTHLSYNNPNITEQFYEKYPDKVDWNKIRNATNVSPAFYTRHMDKIIYNIRYWDEDNLACRSQIEMCVNLLLFQKPNIASNTFTHYIESVIKNEFTLKF